VNVLNSDLDRRIFFGLSKEFVTWEKVAQKALEVTGSKSRIVVEDKGWDANPNLFEVGAMKKEFGLEFVASPEIEKHLGFFARGLKKFI